MPTRKQIANKVTTHYKYEEVPKDILEFPVLMTMCCYGLRGAFKRIIESFADTTFRYDTLYHYAPTTIVYHKSDVIQNISLSIGSSSTYCHYDESNIRPLFWVKKDAWVMQEIFEKYRYAFNGMEKDDEVKGSGNSYTTHFRQYDPRIGRWLSLDPLMAKFPHMSPYNAFANNPIFYVDPYGLEPTNGGDDDENCSDECSDVGGDPPPTDSWTTNDDGTKVHTRKHGDINISWGYDENGEGYGGSASELPELNIEAEDTRTDIQAYASWVSRQKDIIMRQNPIDGNRILLGIFSYRSIMTNIAAGATFMSVGMIAAPVLVEMSPILASSSSSLYSGGQMLAYNFARKQATSYALKWYAGERIISATSNFSAQYYLGGMDVNNVNFGSVGFSFLTGNPFQGSMWGAGIDIRAKNNFNIASPLLGNKSWNDTGKDFAAGFVGARLNNMVNSAVPFSLMGNHQYMTQYGIETIINVGVTNSISGSAYGK